MNLFPNAPVVKVSTLWNQTAARPGDLLKLAVTLHIREPYHINPNTTPDGFEPTVVSFQDLTDGLLGSHAQYPASHEIEFGKGSLKQKISVFSGSTTVILPLQVLPNAKRGEQTIKLKISYQACDDKQCLPPTDLDHSVALPIVGPADPVQQTNAHLFSSFKESSRLKIPFFGWDFEIDPTNLLVLLGLAAAGGFLLNFTPCVLPLIPIKIMGLSRAAGQPGRSALLGMALSLGVISFWLALAIAVTTLTGFNTTNKLFQYPAFTLCVGVIISVMAIGMCGVFSLSLPQWIYRVNPSQESFTGSFLFGVMTAVLSTPCTAPFMGAAAAWAMTQSQTITLTTFAAIGLGMALPYFLLASFPRLVHRMPKTGPASELIKQVMGLLMLGAGMYFLGSGLAGLAAQPPDPPTQAYWWLVSLFVISAGGWLAWKTVQIAQSAFFKVVFSLAGLLLLSLGVFLGVTMTKKSPVHWVYYTPERFAQAQKEGKVIVLEFTAVWCLNCHALEQGVLHNPEIVKLLNFEGVTPIKVDLTSNYEPGNRKLIDTGRRSIPYLAVYSPDGFKVFSSDAYTLAELKAALEMALKQKRRSEETSIVLVPQPAGLGNL